jgi:hypothetical protein
MKNKSLQKSIERNLHGSKALKGKKTLSKPIK